MEDSADKLLAERRRKLDAVRAHGVDPFGARFAVDGAVAEVRAAFAEGRALRAAGRVTAHRDFGKSHFLDLSDLTGRIQIYLNAKNLTPAQAELFALLDIGDFVGVEGEGFTTKTGEPTVRVREFQILGKALRPLPDKWHGLADVEARYRQRYLDLVANARSREIFLTRSKVLRAIRDFFHARGFLEVETPMMQPVAGGAAARPFVTHHNALGTQFYLRIALELYLKRLLVGGFPKVFEIGRNFRNEGLSRRHNPEFTMLEAYWAFADFEQMADLVEELICSLAGQVAGGTRIEHKDADGNVTRTVDLQRPWRRARYHDLIESVAPGWFAQNRLQRIERGLELGIAVDESMEDYEVTQQVFEKLIEEKTFDPLFVTHLPVEL
ncbi:MAG: lysine--tRNA ligase, partial [Verrucomicrobia bacterium]|nr:lysine--tRNA ligase [Verrucomicrobiota bacterium]